MANENKGSESKSAKSGKPNFFKRAANAIVKWFREMRSELKKVVWPTRQLTINKTIIAAVVMVVAGCVLWAFDQVAMFIVQSLISIGG
jgi:preprotein translocase subunit SecE